MTFRWLTLVTMLAACGDDGGSATSMIDIPAGTFSMGCNGAVDPLCTDSATNDEKPQRMITLSAFRIDQTEVTQAAYEGCVNAGACVVPTCNWDPASHSGEAVTCVTIVDAQAFCQYAGKTLPTEAQWEKAARGTDGRIYPWGNSAPSCDLVNRGCGDTLAVGRIPAGASPYGVLDLAGNVAEIVSDFYDAYPAGPFTDPTGPPSGTTRVTRGGSRDSPDSILRTSSRQRIDPGQSAATIGFRCAASP